MPKQIVKRDGSVVPFRKEKIVLAIFKGRQFRRRNRFFARIPGRAGLRNGRPQRRSRTASPRSKASRTSSRRP
ncbi:MAG: hypothetical protein MZU79_01585 [Anaerotruncus sp.]|nr:hypothetical protein [Anaerotruncus sp.]